MIDTDKYEGHYKGSWVNQYGDVVKLVYPSESSPSLDADQCLIIDAPLLLAEVKRFRRMCLNDMVCYDCLSDLYKAGLSDENPVDAYWCGMCCEPMKGLVE